MFGKNLKEMEQYKCWAKLMAINGIGAVTYTYSNPEEDLNKLISYIRLNADSPKVVAAVVCEENNAASPVRSSSVSSKSKKTKKDNLSSSP